MGWRDWFRKRPARSSAKKRAAEESTLTFETSGTGARARGADTRTLPLDDGPSAAAEGPSRSSGPARVVGVLVAVDGELEGGAFALREGVNRLGGGRACEIHLPGAGVAPEHARVEYRSGFFRLEPLAGAELRVNFEPTAGTLLRDGDYVQVGMTTLRFRTTVGA